MTSDTFAEFSNEEIINDRFLLENIGNNAQPIVSTINFSSIRRIDSNQLPQQDQIDNTLSTITNTNKSLSIDFTQSTIQPIFTTIRLNF